MGTGKAFDATVRVTDYVEASIGTSLGPRLLDEAVEAAAESRDAAETVIDPNTELQRCLVAILCAHAAVEAQMNEVADALDPRWWASHERQPIERKLAALIEKRTGLQPLDDDPVRTAVRRLSADRNLVAHFRGIRQPDGSYAVSGPPVEDRGGISPVRAYFDATRAEAAVDDAYAALTWLDMNLGLQPGSSVG